MMFHVFQIRGVDRHQVGHYPERSQAEGHFVRAVEVGYEGDIIELVSEGVIVSRHVIEREEAV